MEFFSQIFTKLINSAWVNKVKTLVLQFANHPQGKIYLAIALVSIIIFLIVLILLLKSIHHKKVSQTFLVHCFGENEQFLAFESGTKAFNRACELVKDFRFINIISITSKSTINLNKNFDIETLECYPTLQFMQSISKFINARLVICEKTKNAIEARVLNKNPLRLIVKSAELDSPLYEVYSFDDQNIRNLKTKHVESLSRAIELFYQNDWQGAIEIFNRIIFSFPSDKIAHYYKNRIESFPKKRPITTIASID